MSSITDTPAYAAGLADGRKIARTIEPISETMHRWEAERALMRQNPKLHAMLRAEAIAGGRAECHVSEAAKLPAIRDLLIAAIEAETGKPFKNPLFP